ncbi:hypothetical protein L211DRAFT_868460 [Terfezia boudieri ATCC MYA-4762]|uniref:Uncharacterized protein n=1 Tax=Terfezia boudieri ATCC MYA-4762 TaxID=1051890 RepID=A0A3N4LQV7_9PEZI|nr:hypothetical protein L211DRAFT_868460 [Terfezia boudieri ATCC MYA-4762]
MKLLHFIPTILLLGGSMVAAHQPMDTSNSIMERDIHSIAASFGEIDTSFSPRAHQPRSIFQKRDICDSSATNICQQTGFLVYCCPRDYTCFYSDGWRCDPNILGLTRGQKIGIGIGVTVAFFVLCTVGFAIFFCCCRKVVRAASNSNTQGVYPPQQPVMYGHTADNTGYYPQQGGSGYEQYGQQQQYPPPQPPPPPPAPSSPYPQSTGPVPYQQPPPSQGGYH